MSSARHNYRVQADGGYRVEHAYGSYNIYQDDLLVSSNLNVTINQAKTGNQAEYWILILALDELMKLCKPVEHSKLIMFTDSELVVKSLNGGYKANKLIGINTILRGKLDWFNWQVMWWKRTNSLKLFRH